MIPTLKSSIETPINGSNHSNVSVGITPFTPEGVRVVTQTTNGAKMKHSIGNNSVNNVNSMQMYGMKSMNNRKNMNMNMNMLNAMNNDTDDDKEDMYDGNASDEYAGDTQGGITDDGSGATPGKRFTDSGFVPGSPINSNA
eukprot:UN05045